MNAPFHLALYSFIIVLVVLGSGAAIFLIHAHSRRHTEFLLAFSAGVMLGAAFFQMIPEILHLGEPKALAGILIGALAMFVLERFVTRQVCDVPEGGCEVHDHASLGIVAFLGLSAHTLFDGVALGSSLEAGIGAVVFLAIIAHKIPSSLALGTLLIHAGYRRHTSLALLFLFSLTVPLGALLYFLLDRAIVLENFTAWVLAFSAGTFLYLALADILPQVHKKVGLRRPAIAALFVGLLAMCVLHFLIGRHSH